MLQLIFQWVMSGIGGAVELLITVFMKALDMDMNTYIGLFPFLATGYKVFRGIGIGLAAVLSLLSLMKFMIPGLFGAREPQDTVPGILFKTFIAGGLIYGGNYILVRIVEIAKIPYNIFLNLNTVNQVEGAFTWDFVTRMVETFTGLEAAEVVFEFFVTVVVAWNIIKLMLEVCERFMMVGILVYTSPPFFAMAACSETMDSFRRWVKMFISACAMMSVSVFFMKLILSGFTVMNSGLTESGVHTFVRLLLLLATCKIAQRADSYLNQLGLGTAQTGGSLLDDMLAAGRAMGSVIGGRSGSGGGSRTSVLGSAAAAMSRNGGVTGKTVDAIRAGKDAYAAGDTKDEMFRKMQDAFQKANTMPRSVTAPARAVKAAAGRDTPAEAVASVGKAVGEQAVNFGSAVAETFNPGLRNEREQSLNQKSADMESASYDAETERTLDNMYAKESADTAEKAGIFEDAGIQAEFAGPSEPNAFSDELAGVYSMGRTTAGEEARENFARYGAIDPDTGASMTVDRNGEIRQMPRASAAGVSIEANSSAPAGGRILTGTPEAVAEVIAGGYNPPDAVSPAGGYVSAEAEERGSEAFRNLAEDTVRIGSPEIADRLLHNPNLPIGGNQGLPVGAAAMFRLYPDLVPEESSVAAVETFHNPAGVPASGQPGGFGWHADIRTDNGIFRYTAINTAAYSALEPAEQSAYTRRQLTTGRVEYLRKEIPTPEMTEELASRDSRFAPTVPARTRNPDGRRTQSAYRNPNDIPGYGNTAKKIARYTELRRRNHPDSKRKYRRK